MPEKNTGLGREMKKYRTMYLFLLPAVAVVTVFAYVPMGGRGHGVPGL